MHLPRNGSFTECKLRCPPVFGAATSCPHPKCDGESDSKAYKKGHVPGCVEGARPPGMAHGDYNTSQVALRKKKVDEEKEAREGAVIHGAEDVDRARVGHPPPATHAPSCLARNRPRQVRPTPCPCRRASCQQWSGFLRAIAGTARTIATSLVGLHAAGAAESRMVPGACGARADGTPLYPWGGATRRGRRV